MQTPQIIRFTIHAPAAPNVRCSVDVWNVDGMRNLGRCEHDAIWGVVSPDPNSRRYTMTAYCDLHFRTWEYQQEQSSVS